MAFILKLSFHSLISISLLFIPYSYAKLVRYRVCSTAEYDAYSNEMRTSVQAQILDRYGNIVIKKEGGFIAWNKEATNRTYLPDLFYIEKSCKHSPRKAEEVYVLLTNFTGNANFITLDAHISYLKEKLENYNDLSRGEQKEVVRTYQNLYPVLSAMGEKFGEEFGLGGSGPPPDTLNPITIPAILIVLTVVCCLLTIGNLSACCNTSGQPMPP